MTRGVSVVLPVFNEELAIGRVLEQLRAVLEGMDMPWEIVVVDDGSTDRSAHQAHAAGARVIRHPRNRGYGASLKSGIAAASHEIVTICDADGTYPVDRIPDLVSRIDHAEMAVGARLGANVNIPLVRRPAKWFLNLVANLLSGAKIPDMNSGLRAFRRQAALEHFAILPDRFSWTTTITLALHCEGRRVDYIPIDYFQRTGKSKIVPWDAVRFLGKILRTVMLFHPVRVATPLLAISALGGFGALRSGESPAGVASAALCIGGIVTLLWVTAPKWNRPDAAASAPSSIEDWRPDRDAR